MIVALVLAAGRSSRMGRPKLEMDFGGMTVLERTLLVLRSVPVDPLLLIVSPDKAEAARRYEAGVEVVTNPDPDEGLGSSIRVGIAAVPSETRAVLLALADKPLVRAETVRRLLARFEGDESEPQIVVPVHRGRQGHPVLFARRHFSELSTLSGDEGARSVIERHFDRVASIDVDDPGVLLDIDNPQDYAKCLKLLKD